MSDEIRMGAGEGWAALMHERDHLRSALATATAERDALRGEVVSLRSDLANTARGIAPFNGTEFALAVRECEREIAEAIAAFIDTEAETRREEGFSYRAVSELAAAIRAGQWHPSPATDKEE